MHSKAKEKGNWTIHESKEEKFQRLIVKILKKEKKKMELIKAIKIIWNHQCNDIKGEKCACLRTSFMFENFLSPFIYPHPVYGTLMIFI